MPPRRIVRIFAKGNVDVRDSLLWSKVGGVLQWNGINEVLRARHPHAIARVRHETCTRLDLIPLPGEIPGLAPPAEVAARPARQVAPHRAPAATRRCSMNPPMWWCCRCSRPPPTRWCVTGATAGCCCPTRSRAGMPKPAPGWHASANTQVSLTSTSCSRALRQLIPAIEERTGAQVLVYNLNPPDAGRGARIAGSARRIPSRCACNGSTCGWPNCRRGTGILDRRCRSRGRRRRRRESED